MKDSHKARSPVFVISRWIRRRLIGQNPAATADEHLDVEPSTSGNPADSETEVSPKTQLSWLYQEGPEEPLPGDDDFEGNRNWAVIIVLMILVFLPIVALIFVIF